MLIRAKNPKGNAKEVSYLATPASAGESELTLLNNDGYSKDDYVVVEQIGAEQAEIAQISSVTGGNNITLQSPLSHSHGSNAKVTTLEYNQIEFSRKTSESGAFSVLDTIDIQPDQDFTIYDDTTGQTTYFYRHRFKNEDTGQFSSYSATRSARTSEPDTRELSTMIDMVLLNSEDENADYTSRKQVLQYLQQAYEEVTSKLVQASNAFYQTSVEIPTENSKYEYTLPDNFREIQEVRDSNGQVVPPARRRDNTDFVRGYELTGLNTIRFGDVPRSNDGDTAPTTVLQNNAFDEDGTWTASKDATNITTDLDEFKLGNGSINFDIDVSADASNTAVLTNSTMTAQDLSDYEDTGKWRTWIFIPDVTYTQTTELKWGTDASNYWELTGISEDYKNEAFHDGWNLVEFDWSSDDVTETGTPDAEDIGYLQLTMTYTANQPDDEDYRLDGFLIDNTYAANNVYEIIYTKQPDKLTGEMDQVELPQGYANLLQDYANAHIMLRKGERDITAQKMLDRFYDKLGKFVAQSAKRTRRPIGFSLYGYKRQYNTTHRGTNIVSTDDDFIVRKI